MGGDTGTGPDAEPGTPLGEIDWGPIIPRLQRFYGAASPLSWWQLPLFLLEAHLTYLPMLQAEESMRWAEAISVGGGHLKKDAARRVTRQWRDAMRVTPPERPTKEQFLMNLGMLGIAVEFVE